MGNLLAVLRASQKSLPFVPASCVHFLQKAKFEPTLALTLEKGAALN